MNYDNQQDVEGLESSARDLATHAEELLNKTKDMTSEGIANLRAKLTQSLSTAKEQLSAAQSYAVERGKYAANATDDYVHDKPWQAIAIAAAVGVVIGFLSAPSRR